MRTTRMLTTRQAETATQVCPMCRTTFGAKRTPKGHFYITTYCSKSCAKYFTSPERPTRVCGQCGKNFHQKPSFQPMKVCSRACRDEARRNTSTWTVRKNGYHVFWTGKAEVPVHRIVMERRLGRPLRETETVHHINGMRDDNADANLELWDHAQPHGQRVPDKIAWCIAYLTDHGYTVHAPSD